MSTLYPLAIVDAASITTQVRMTLQYYLSISAPDVQVETNQGVVTLEGKARDAAYKDMITQLVNGVYGVRRVNNQMRIEKAKSQ